MGKDKATLTEKEDQGYGDVCYHGILGWTNRRIFNAIIVKGYLVFLGRNSPTQDTTNDAHIKGEF